MKLPGSGLEPRLIRSPNERSTAVRPGTQVVLPNLKGKKAFQSELMSQIAENGNRALPNNKVYARELIQLPTLLEGKKGPQVVVLAGIGEGGADMDGYFKDNLAYLLDKCIIVCDNLPTALSDEHILAAAKNLPAAIPELRNMGVTIEGIDDSPLVAFKFKYDIHTQKANALVERNDLESVVALKREITELRNDLHDDLMNDSKANPPKFQEGSTAHTCAIETLKKLDEFLKLNPKKYNFPPLGLGRYSHGLTETKINAFNAAMKDLETMKVAVFRANQAAILASRGDEMREKWARTISNLSQANPEKVIVFLTTSSQILDTEFEFAEPKDADDNVVGKAPSTRKQHGVVDYLNILQKNNQCDLATPLVMGNASQKEFIYGEILERTSTVEEESRMVVDGKGYTSPCLQVPYGLYSD
jgi:hypothetical protein